MPGIKWVPLVLLFLASAFLSAQLPPDFTDEVVDENFSRLVGVTFAPDGHGYVWERSGLVHVYDPAGNRLPDPLIDLTEEVADWWDMGMLGFALDPEFLENGFCYFYYVVDRHHLLYYGTSGYDPTITITNEATIARITRYTADPASGFTKTLPDSRQVLVGETIDTGIPMLFKTHGIGSLVFGTDGTLLASCGDSAFPDQSDVGSNPNSYYEQALADGIIRPKENIGTFRSQLVDCLNGKILRIDPATGDGLPSNPFYDASAPRAARSRVWALGFRNPFRFTVKPSSGSHYPGDGNPGHLYVGDVGSNYWEELTILTQGGQNAGWPLYEGHEKKWDFFNFDQSNLDAPNPLYENGDCTQEFFYFQDLFVPDEVPSPGHVNPCDPSLAIPANIPVFSHHRSAVAYRNYSENWESEVLLPGYDDEGQGISYSISAPFSGVEGERFDGISSMGGFFMPEGLFPDNYDNRYFHMDYSGWIRVLDFNENNQLVKVEPFHLASKDIVAMAVHPVDGCLYFADIKNQKLHRVCYGGIPAPQVVATADVSYGPSPLTVHFSGAGSSSVLSAPLTFFWDFGDGFTSTDTDPVHQYVSPDAKPQAYSARLTVSDSLGQSRTAELLISLNNTPPVAKITSIPSDAWYTLSGTHILRLEGEAQDQEFAASELSYSWRTYLHHEDHFHTDLVGTGQRTYTQLSPLGCEDEVYWYRIELTVSDPAGLTGIDTRQIYPYCGSPFFNWIDLRAIPGAESVQLEWELEEIAVAGFEIERSGPFNDFRLLAVLPATGTGSYQWTDPEPFYDLNKYRIRILSPDHIFDYSETETVLYPGPGSIRLFPNPFQESLTLQVGEAYADQLELDLFNALGETVATWKIPAEKGAPLQQMLFVPAAGNGLYYFRLKNGGQRQSGSLLRLK